MQIDFEEVVSKKVDEFIVVKELEKVEIEEKFVKELEVIKIYKDGVIVKLKDKIREKIELNKKNIVDFKLKLVNV